MEIRGGGLCRSHMKPPLPYLEKEMKEILEEAQARFEEGKSIVVEHAYALYEIDKMRSLGGTYQSILTSLYRPFLQKVLEFNPTIFSCDMRRFLIYSVNTSNILEPIQSLIDVGVRFVLAGGKMIDWLNNKTIAESTGDYDLFFTDEDNFLIAQVLLTKMGYEILSDKMHVVEMFNTNRGIKIQLVKTLFSGPDEVIASFDIRACAVAYADGKVWWSRGALKDIRDKKVVMQSLRPSKLAWVRPLKYYSKGYTIAPADLALISYSFLMSMENNQNSDIYNYFTDREGQYSSALEGTLYDVFTGVAD